MNYHKFIFFIYLSLLVTGFSAAQSRTYKIYNENDGLPSSTIYSIFQDSKGYIWLATDKGVSKYDGYHFNNYMVADGLSDSEIFDFYEDSFGKIWFYTLNGRVSYYKDNKFYNSSNDSSLLELDSKSMITSVFEDSLKNIWVATLRDGLLRYQLESHKSKKVIEGNNYGSLRNSFALSNNKIMLIYSCGIAKVTINNGKIKNTNRWQFPNNRCPIHISKYALISDEKYWFSSRGLIYQSDVMENSVELIYDEQNSETNINNLSRIGDIVWICTTNGVFQFSINNHSFSRPVLENYNISSVLKDSEGNYWFGTLDNGVLFRSSNAVYSYNNQDGLLDKNITKLFKENEENIWFVYKKGKIGSVSKKLKIKNFALHDRLLDKMEGVNSLLFNEDSKWISTNIALIRQVNTRQNTYPFTTKDMIIDNNKYFWLAAPNGLYVFEPKAIYQYKNLIETPKETAHQRVLKKRVSKLFMDSNCNIWIATQHELYKKEHSDAKLGEKPILENLKINDFVENAKGSILMATIGSGIAILNANNKVEYLTSSDGLSSNICSAIAVDKDSTIWVTTNNGLNRISGYPHNINVENYNTIDGLSSGVINDVLIVNDTIWLATNNGLNFFDKNQFNTKKPCPILHINNLTVNGTDYRFSKNDNMLNYDQNNLLVSYVGISTSSGGDVTYRYKLTENDPWTYTQNQSVNFSSLSPGNYNFIISSKGKNSDWSEEASFDFQILKPFWQTNFFILSVIIISILLLWFLIMRIIKNQHIKQSREKKLALSELRSLKAQISPHFIFNALNSIQGELLKNKPEIARNYLTKLGRLMRTVLDQSDYLYVKVEQEISVITEYLEIERFKTGNKYTYSIEVEPKVDVFTMEIPSMILQPFIENALWHGFSEKKTNYKLVVNFGLTIESDLSIVIEDNGIGRNKAKTLTKKTHKSKGLEMVRERMEALNYGKANKMKFEIKDLLDEEGEGLGTQVQIIIPQ